MNRRTRNILIIGASGIVFIIIIAVTGARYMHLVPAFTLVLYAGLIVVTMVYAYFSMEIAESTRHQAEASANMADETKRQRYSESLPLLVPTIPPILNTDELPYESLQSGVGLKVLWRNLGKGVAN